MMAQYHFWECFKSAIIYKASADKPIYDIIVYDNNDKKCNDDWHLEHDEYFFPSK